MGFVFPVSFVNAQNWAICENGPEYRENGLFTCFNAWYGSDYVRQYWRDVYYQVSFNVLFD